jgi:hypothetical protein
VPKPTVTESERGRTSGKFKSTLGLTNGVVVPPMLIKVCLYAPEVSEFWVKDSTTGVKDE